MLFRFLSKNKFTMLTGRPFKGMKKSGVSINLFSNDIHTIEKEFLEDLEGTTKITVDCQSLKSVPHLPRSAEIFCTEYNSHRWINHLPLSVSKSLSKSAYLCKTINQFAQNCMPCIKGTFGAKGKCFNCSAGGFFQDELAQMYCKRCNIGTFVHPNNAPATGPLMCQACPQGTQSSEWSGYRACKCLKSFYRFDRFGRCFPCSRQGWNCTNDYASLSEGYYWKWKNESMKNDYSNYIKNLMVEGKEYTSGVWTFTGSLPVPHKCPLNSCRGGLNSSCVTGYHGPLCSLCDVGYYKRANSCIRCPSRIWATVEVVIVILQFVFILLAIMLGDRKKVDNEKGRTIADKILSCFKIVLGFYQVISAIYSVSIQIEWPLSVIWMEKVLKYVQFNVLEVAPLSCISSTMSFNVLQEFAIVICLNAGVVSSFLLYFVIRISFLRRRRSTLSQRDTEKAILKSKISCIRNICIFLFASYPKICSSVIQVLPMNCLKLCFDSHHEHCISYLRADFSILCNDSPGYIKYSRTALGCLFYLIGFPMVVMFLVWIYASKEDGKDNGGQCNAEYKLITPIVFSTTSESPFKAGLRLFSENYKPNCWYWEGLEMIRKLVLVSGLTLIGKHSRTQVGLGALVSALFAFLYVFKRPIKNNFENYLQTISLMAIFLNLSIGTMLKSSDNSAVIINKHNDDIGVSALLIIINILVIGLIIVAVMKVVITKLIQCCRSPTGISFLDRFKACMSCCMSLLLIEKTSRGSFSNDANHERDALINESRDV